MGAPLLPISSTEPPLGAFLSDIATRLADEGVPVLAIARAIKHPYDVVSATLLQALSAGRIITMPRDDWPAKKQDARVPTSNLRHTEHTQIVLNAIKTFKVTRLQARILGTLLKQSECTKEMLHTVVEQSRDPTKDTTDPKIVDVVICHLRKKLKPFDLAIQTIWSCGYFMEPPHRARALNLLGLGEDTAIVTEQPVAPAKEPAHVDPVS